MTLRDEIGSMQELATMGDWSVECLEDRDRLFDDPISPEKACFIGSVCAHDALEDLRELGSVSNSSATASLEAFTELDAEYNFSELIQEVPSLGLKRLMVAKSFWSMRVSGNTNGYMFVSAEQNDYDLVGEIDMNPVAWKICDTSQQLNGYDLAMRTGSMLVASVPFVEAPVETVEHVSTGSNALPRGMSLSRLSLL